MEVGHARRRAAHLARRRRARRAHDIKRIREPVRWTQVAAEVDEGIVESGPRQASRQLVIVQRDHLLVAKLRPRLQAEYWPDASQKEAREHKFVHPGRGAFVFRELSAHPFRDEFGKCAGDGFKRSIFAKYE